MRRRWNNLVAFGTVVVVVALAVVALVAWCVARTPPRETVEAFQSARAPASQSPVYDPSKYTSDPYVQNSHNCYAYALDAYDPTRAQKCQHLLNDPQATKKTCFALRPKPGRISHTHLHLPYAKRMTCEKMRDGVLADVPDASVTTRTDVCPPHQHKIAFAVDEGRTYHFYRQDADGGWSHKDAWRPVTRVDASGEVITDPADADRHYAHADLSNFCGYLCVGAGADVQ